MKNLKEPNGVFPDLGCAFFDRVRLSVHRKLLTRPWRLLTERRNVPCAGKGSYFARNAEGTLDLTANRFQVNYATFTRLPRMPQALLWLDAEHAPLTVAEMVLAARSLSGRPAKVTYAELAWDIRGTFDDVARQVVSVTTRRRLPIVNPKTGRRTLYLGTRKGERQVCLYDKASGVVRLEIRLRSRGLRRLGIIRADQLLLLRSVDFKRLVAFCELQLPAVVQESWRRNLWRYCAQHQPLETVLRDFTCFYPIPRSKLLRPTALDVMIRKMQSRLVC